MKILNFFFAECNLMTWTTHVARKRRCDSKIVVVPIPPKFTVFDLFDRSIDYQNLYSTIYRLQQPPLVKYATTGRHV